VLFIHPEIVDAGRLAIHRPMMEECHLHRMGQVGYIDDMDVASAAGANAPRPFLAHEEIARFVGDRVVEPPPVVGTRIGGVHRAVRHE
jgi:hypothetical protein